MMEIFTMITSGIITISALIGAIVAIIGLTAWKKQLRGKTDYELARRYLRSIYKVRDAVGYVRNPFISVDEMALALEEEGKEQTLISDNEATNRAVYIVRWKRVTEANSDLDVELKEAEVSWGDEAVEIQKGFQNNVKKLFINLKMFLRDKDLKNDREVIYDYGEKDPFNKSMKEEVEKIETYLRPHLK